MKLLAPGSGAFASAGAVGAGFGDVVAVWAMAPKEVAVAINVAMSSFFIFVLCRGAICSIRLKRADLGGDLGSRLTLDFNFAYYPSCACSEAWACALSPIENRLPVAIRGGEQNALA